MLKNINIKNWLKKTDFTKMTPKFFKKIFLSVIVLFLLIFLFIFFQIYIPINPTSHETISYTVQKGWGDEEIAKDLEKLGIIRSDFFFNFYTLMSLQDSRLQAGEYNFSPRMSVYKIVKKMVKGDTAKSKIIILEGWTVKKIGEYLNEKGFCGEDEFIKLSKKNYADEFEFLKERPNGIGLEGYIFPDTYEVDKVDTCEDILVMTLINFKNKIAIELIEEIEKKDKSIFEIVIMASIIEKEVSIKDEKKIVSGIFWNRMRIGMPLQADSTINYITDKNNPSALYRDLKIDSSYNTYKYKGLPKGPISSPGISSIKAAINPIKTNYLYFLSNGRTYFSETFEQHKAARIKYLK